MILEEKRKQVLMPWEGPHADRAEIPWADRTYALSLSTGYVVVLDEKWLPDPVVIGKMRKAEDSVPDNNGKYPVMDYPEAMKLRASSEESGEPLSVCFAKLYGRERMTIDQLGKLAHVPKMYAKPSAKLTKIAKSKKREVEDEMLEVAGVSIPDVLKDGPTATLEIKPIAKK